MISTKMITTPIILTCNSRVDGAKYIGTHKFKSGHEVPLYELSSTEALNQIIGHGKFNNSEYGSAYYRGISGLLLSLQSNRRRTLKYRGVQKGSSLDYSES